MSRRPLRQVASRDSVVCKVCVFSERGWIEETCNGARVLLQGAPVIRRTRLTDKQAYMPADWRTGWGPDWLTGWLTNLPTEGLTGCLVDWRRAREQSFPTCSPPRRISAGERCLVPFAVFTVWSPAVGVQPRFISTLGPETPLLRPPLISNRDFLSLSPSLSPLPFSLAPLRPQTCWMRPFWKS